MVEVFRNHCHGSSVIVSKITRDGTAVIRKSSYSNDGIKNLRREYQGFKWYNSRREFPVKVDYLDIDDRYFEFCIEALVANPPVCRSFSYENIGAFHSSINHYVDIWFDRTRSGDLYPVHGDFSLDGNILFTRKSVVIIDWEHFHHNRAPLGFDVLFLIFEGLKIAIGKKIPTKHQVELVNELIKYAGDKGALGGYFSGMIFSKFLKIQSEIRCVWGDQISKIPTFQFSERQIKHIASLVVL